MKKRLVVRVVEVAAKRYTFGLYRDCITENVINKSILFSNKHIYAICLKALGTKSKLIYNRPLSMGLRVHRTVHVRTHVCVQFCYFIQKVIFLCHGNVMTEENRIINTTPTHAPNTHTHSYTHLFRNNLYLPLNGLDPVRRLYAHSSGSINFTWTKISMRANSHISTLLFILDRLSILSSVLFQISWHKEHKICEVGEMERKKYNLHEINEFLMVLTNKSKRAYLRSTHATSHSRERFVAKRK